MRSAILIVELTVPESEETWNEWYQSEHMPSLLDEVPAIVRGTRYRISSGDDAYPYIVLYEFDDAASLRQFLSSDTIRRKKNEYVERWGTTNRRGGYRRVLQMSRTDSGGPPIHVDAEAMLDSNRASLLTVRLAIPEDREDEWNDWYRHVHMPAVMDQVRAIRVGHRFSLVGNGGEPHYLVLYEFESERDLDSWQRSQSVSERVDEYWERWGVRNLRRAYQQVWRLDRGNSVG